MALTNEEIFKLMNSRGQAATRTAMDLARESERELQREVLGMQIRTGVDLDILLDKVRTEECMRVIAEFIHWPKEEGTKFWMSWTESNSGSDVEVSTDLKPAKHIRADGSVYYNGHGLNSACYIEERFAEYIGLKKGECKMFEIREVSNGDDK